jgi:hypothetical protein
MLRDVIELTLFAAFAFGAFAFAIWFVTRRD